MLDTLWMSISDSIFPGNHLTGAKTQSSQPITWLILANKIKQQPNYKYASYPDWRISPHADLPRLHSQQWRPDAASSPASLSHLARNWTMHYCTSFFSLGANPWAKVHHNMRWPPTHPGLPSCQISSPCVNLRRRHKLQNMLQRKKQRNKQ